MPTITYTPIPQVVFSGSGSTTTSSAYLVQDYNVISVSIASSTTVLQILIQGSNDDGLQSAIVNWSSITSINPTGVAANIFPGVFSITPGMRWLRFGSPVSNCTLILAGNAF
jgi:hypothetical protein